MTYRNDVVMCEIAAEKDFFTPIRRVAALAFFFIILSVCSLRAQEVIDPRSGQLFVTVTDIRVQAGPVVLAVERSFEKRKEANGLIGSRWCLNWEGSLFRAGPMAVVQDGPRFIPFDRKKGSVYQSFAGEKVVFDEYGKGLREVPSGEKYTYDPEGRLVEIKDGNGNRISLHYSEYGILERIEGPAGAYLLFRYHDNGLVAAIESSAKTVVEYGYDQEYLLEVKVNGAETARYRYGKDGHLAGIERPLTGKMDLTYDAKGRVTTRRWADGGQEQFQFDEVNHTCRYTDASGAVTTIQRSSDGRREEITDPNGYKTVIKYNSDSRPEIVTDPSGGVTRISYDTLGRTVAVEGCCDRKTVFEYEGKTPLLKAVIYPDGSRQEFIYDKANNLLTVTQDKKTLTEITYSPEGYVLGVKGVGIPAKTFTYYTDGNVQSETNALGETTRFQYDPQGRLAQEIDPGGGMATWSYDRQGRILSFTDPAGAVTRYAYDKKGRLINETDPTGGMIQYEYDAVGRMVAEVDPLGRKTIYAYDANGRLKELTDPAGNTQRFAYGKDGMLIKAVDPLGAVNEYTYGPTGQLASETDPLGRKWRYEYSTDGLSRKVIGPDKQALRIEMNQKTRQKRVTDEKGLSVTYQYDENGLITGLTFPGGASLSYSYDNAGNLLSTSDSSGPNVKYSYDLLGRVVKEKHGSGLEILYQYDAAGNLARVQDRLRGLGKLAAMLGKKGGGETILKYNPQGLPVEHITPEDAVTRFRHDLAGRLLEQTDPLGGTRRMAYNAAGELVEVTGPSGDKARYEYDKSGFLKAIHHPAGGVTRIASDAVGNVLSVTDPLGNKISYTYDKASRLVWTSDASGRKTTYSYDKLDRLVKKVLPDGNQISYTYDDQGNLIEVNDGAFPVQFAYDDLGRLTQRRYPAIRRILKYAYDDQDRLAAFTDSEGRRLEYQYDKYGRLDSIFLPKTEAAEDQDEGSGGKLKLDNLLDKKGKTVRFTYDGKNRLTLVTYPNGVKGKWKYDVMDRPVEIGYKKGIEKTILGWKFSYDKAGNPVAVVETSGRESRYIYNKAGQLTEELDGSSRTSYYYRPGGNREILESPEGTEKYEYNEADQLVRAGNKRFKYDANGNLIERHSPEGVTRYTYNSENRLVQVTLPDSSHVRFGYAPTGERIWREDNKGRTWFVSDGQNLLAELDEDLNTNVSFVQGPGIDRPLMMWQQGTSYHYHTGLLGTVAGLTDEEGALIATYQTDAFGNLKAAIKGQVANPFIYTGRYLEAMLELYYYRARFYDPKLGRFISQDPKFSDINNPGTLNKYVYVFNNPLTFRDPLGLEADYTFWHYTDKAGLDGIRESGGIKYSPAHGMDYKIFLTDIPPHRVCDPSKQFGVGAHRIEYAVPVRLDEIKWNDKPFEMKPRDLQLKDPRYRNIYEIRGESEEILHLPRMKTEKIEAVKWPLDQETPPPTPGKSSRVMPRGVAKKSAKMLRRRGSPAGNKKVLRGQRKGISGGPSGSTSASSQTGQLRSFVQGHGGSIATFMFTTEQILRCRNQGMTSGECVRTLLTQAAVGAGMGVATAALVATAPATAPVVVIVGGVAMTVKGFYNMIEIGHGGRQYLEARLEEERILKAREKWTKVNAVFMDEMVLREREAIHAELGGATQEIARLCASMAAISQSADDNGREARAAVSKLPSADVMDRVKEASGQCERAVEIQGELQAVHDQIHGWTQKVKGGLDWADSRAASCRTKEEAVTLKRVYSDCAGLVEGIDQNAAKAMIIGRELAGIEVQVNGAKAILASALGLKNRVDHFCAKAVARNAEFDTAYDRVTALNGQLGGLCNRFIQRIENLRMAFPHNYKAKDDVFNELKGLVASYRTKTCHAEPLKARFMEGITWATEAKLKAESDLRGLRGLEASLQGYDPSAGSSLLSAIDSAKRDAASFLIVNSDLPQRAEECLRRAEEEDSEDGDGFGVLGQEDGEEDGSGSDGFAEISQGDGPPEDSANLQDPDILRAIKDSNEARQRSRNGQQRYSYKNLEKSINDYVQDLHRQQLDSTRQARQDMQDIMTNMVQDLGDIQKETLARKQARERQNKMDRDAAKYGLKSDPFKKYRPWVEESQRRKEERERRQQGKEKYPDPLSGEPNVPSTDDPSPGGGGTGMSYQDCLYKYCPMCAEAIDIGGISASDPCNNCKKNKAAAIKKCTSGGSSSTTSTVPLQPQQKASTVPSQPQQKDGYWKPWGAGKVEKNYYAARRYQPKYKNYHYVIGKTEYGGLSGYHILYGPSTFENCRKWLFEKGYW